MLLSSTRPASQAHCAVCLGGALPLTDHLPFHAFRAAVPDATRARGALQSNQMALRAVTAKDATLEFVSNQITGDVWYDGTRPGTLVIPRSARHLASSALPVPVRAAPWLPCCVHVVMRASRTAIGRVHVLRALQPRTGGTRLRWAATRMPAECLGMFVR